MDELGNEIKAEMVEQSLDELIELLKKTEYIQRHSKRILWDTRGFGSKLGAWVVYDTNKVKTLYRGDSIIEALKILTEEK